jgi:hypothetical protein
MIEQAKHVMPLALTLAGGKDLYPRVYEELFGRPPAVSELKLPEARPLPVEELSKTKRARRASGGAKEKR